MICSIIVIGVLPPKTYTIPTQNPMSLRVIIPGWPKPQSRLSINQSIPLLFADRHTLALTLRNVYMEGPGGVLYTDCETYAVQGYNTNVWKEMWKRGYLRAMIEITGNCAACEWPIPLLWVYPQPSSLQTLHLSTPPLLPSMMVWIITPRCRWTLWALPQPQLKSNNPWSTSCTRASTTIITGLLRALAGTGALLIYAWVAIEVHFYPTQRHFCSIHCIYRSLVEMLSHHISLSFSMLTTLSRSGMIAPFIAPPRLIYVVALLTARGLS